MPNTEKSVFIFESTPVIAWPLFAHLSKSLQNPVYRSAASQPHVAQTMLQKLSEKSEVYAIATDETSLNLLTRIVKDIPSTGNTIVIPGTANLDRCYSPAELSNKLLVQTLCNTGKYSSFRLVDTVSFQWNGNDNDFAQCKNMRFPVVLKPSDKDSLDAFTRKFPSKIAVLDSFEALRKLLHAEQALLLSRTLQVQRLVTGINISWFGYRTAGKTTGFCIVPVVKSPKAPYGGTTTLAKRIPAEKTVVNAVDEIASHLGLDGIFEIEFLKSETELFFFYEINPRPILQTALALGKPDCVFTGYLETKGFSRTKAVQHGRALRYWGSALRYLFLNGKKDFNSIIFLRIILHEIMFTRFFTFKEKKRYCIDLAREFKRMMRR